MVDSNCWTVRLSSSFFFVLLADAQFQIETDTNQSWMRMMAVMWLRWLRTDGTNWRFWARFTGTASRSGWTMNRWWASNRWRTSRTMRWRWTNGTIRFIGHRWRRFASSSMWWFAGGCFRWRSLASCWAKCTTGTFGFGNAADVIFRCDGRSFSFIQRCWSFKYHP